jgi:hypothetical protein
VSGRTQACLWLAFLTALALATFAVYRYDCSLACPHAEQGAYDAINSGLPGRVEEFRAEAWELCADRKEVVRRIDARVDARRAAK